MLKHIFSFVGLGGTKMEETEKIFKHKEEKALKRFYGKDGIYVRINVTRDCEEKEDDRKIMLDYAGVLGEKVAEDTATKKDYLTAAEILYILSCHSDVKWIRHL